jgi:Thiamine pyrophosphate enzyme, N-terminal TPP binding domain
MAFQKMSNYSEHMRSPEERVFVEEPEVSTTTVGSYLAQRLVEAGTSTFFTVPGDYILGLLDSLLKNKGLKMVGCCNELNGGYAGTRTFLRSTLNTTFPDNPNPFAYNLDSGWILSSHWRFRRTCCNIYGRGTLSDQRSCRSIL